MSRLRLALAVLAAVIAASAQPAAADQVCPSIIRGPQPYGVCAYTGGGSCESCKYECGDGETYTWNMCNFPE